MPTFFHGKTAGYGLFDSSTTYRNITTYLTSISFPYSADTAEVTTFNTTNYTKAYVAGNKDGTISIEGKWDTTIDGYISGIVGLSKGFKYFPATTDANSTAGDFINKNGNAICTSYNVDSSIDDAVSWSAEFQVTGTVSRTTTT